VPRPGLIVPADPPAERTLKYRALKVVLRAGNRTLCWALRRDIGPRAFALLETTGRRSGRPRQTPVGDGLDGERFWLIAVHGRQSDYVLNLIAQPRVRVKVNRSWRCGTAVLLPGDDTRQRSRTLPYRWDAAIGRALATTPVTVRIDLDAAIPGLSAVRSDQD
jgi:deazaflavin-dependent oxidoreductase (nitroreductase family)